MIKTRPIDTVRPGGSVGDTTVESTTTDDGPSRVALERNADAMADRGPVRDSAAGAVVSQGGRLTPSVLAAAFKRETRSTGDSTHPGYRFARDFDIARVMADPAHAKAFLDAYVAGESRYFAIARDPDTGLTYDGINLDPHTGEIIEVRPHSAPSKECLDIGVLIKALRGVPEAVTLLGATDASQAREQAAAILTQKLASYRAFHERHPGYGGYLPWFRQDGGRIEPTADWVGDIPGLDNGEWVWTLLVAEEVLREEGFVELAADYGRYNELLRANAARIFYDPQARCVRADVHVVDPDSSATEYETIRDRPGRMSHLTGEHGVHEGMMLVLYLTLFADALPPDAADRIWDDITMRRVEHPHGTTWQAYWGSAHESWAHLFIPLRDIDGFRTLFRQREVIRSQNAAERGYPGFGTSTNRPGDDGWVGYLSASGIEGIGSQPVENNDVFAIYGAFPMLLEHAGRTVGNYGLAWLLNMLQAPRAQGPWGGGESVTNDGQRISPTKTVDGTLPNLLALMGGIATETAQMLKKHGLYRRFIERMKGELDEAFGHAPLRTSSGFALPSTQVPRDGRPEYEPTDGSESDS